MGRPWVEDLDVPAGTPDGHVPTVSSGVLELAAPAAVPAKHQLVPFSYTGVVALAVGTHRLYAERALTVVTVRASVGTAPTGASLIVDVNKNGTTIFTSQSNRPQIAAGAFTDLADAIEVASLVAGDYLTVDVDQIGSTVAGSNLVVTVEVAE